MNPAAAAAIDAMQVPGVHLLREYRRYYPAGEVTGHLLGFTNIDDKGTTFEVVLQRSNFAGGNLLGIHLQYHEFGHVIVNSWATEQTYERLFSYWSASSLWQSCYPQNSDAIDPCVSLDEIAADQFAFWAGSKKATRSSYNLPPLGTAAKMTKILKEDGLIARSRH